MHMHVHVHIYACPTISMVGVNPSPKPCSSRCEKCLPVVSLYRIIRAKLSYEHLEVRTRRSAPEEGSRERSVAIRIDCSLGPHRGDSRSVASVPTPRADASSEHLACVKIETYYLAGIPMRHWGCRESRENSEGIPRWEPSLLNHILLGSYTA